MQINFEKLGGIIPAVIQDATTGQILMLGFMNAEALEQTCKTGEVIFYSRSRQRLWRKGEQSGHRLRVAELRIDCDADAMLVRVVPLGPGVCHEGYRSCFFRRIEPDGSAAIVVEDRAFDPVEVYPRGEVL